MAGNLETVEQMCRALSVIFQGENIDPVKSTIALRKFGNIAWMHMEFTIVSNITFV